MLEEDPSGQANEERITPNFMTKYEKARIIGKTITRLTRIRNQSLADQ